jgi:hypothetical protein
MGRSFHSALRNHGGLENETEFVSYIFQIENLTHIVLKILIGGDLSWLGKR